MLKDFKNRFRTIKFKTVHNFLKNRSKRKAILYLFKNLYYFTIFSTNAHYLSIKMTSALKTGKLFLILKLFLKNLFIWVAIVKQVKGMFRVVIYFVPSLRLLKNKMIHLPRFIICINIYIQYVKSIVITLIHNSRSILKYKSIIYCLSYAIINYTLGKYNINVFGAERALAIEEKSDDTITMEDIIKSTVSDEKRKANLQSLKHKTKQFVGNTVQTLMLVKDTFTDIRRTTFGRLFLEDLAIYQISLTTAIMAKCSLYLTVPGSPSYCALQVVKASASIVSSGAHVRMMETTMDFPRFSTAFKTILVSVGQSLILMHEKYQKENPLGPKFTRSSDHICPEQDKAEYDPLLMNFLFSKNNKEPINNVPFVDKIYVIIQDANNDK